MYICTLHNTTLSFLALFCLRSKRVATCIMVIDYVPHPISSYSVCVSLSIFSLDLNVKHWYKKTVIQFIFLLVVTNFHETFS